MPLYTYSALNVDDNVINGTIDSLSVEAARNTLKAMQLKVTEVHEATLTEQSSLSHSLEGHPNLQSSDSWSYDSPDQSNLDSIPDLYPDTSVVYLPFVQTARLYAGWLLAWYFLVMAVGAYQMNRSLPFEIPYVQALLLSSLVHACTLMAFLFLCFSSLQVRLHHKTKTTIALSLVGFGILYLYYINIV